MSSCRGSLPCAVLFCLAAFIFGADGQLQCTSAVPCSFRCGGYSGSIHAKLIQASGQSIACSDGMMLNSEVSQLAALQEPESMDSLMARVTAVAEQKVLASIQVRLTVTVFMPRPQLQLLHSRTHDAV